MSSYSLLEAPICAGSPTDGSELAFQSLTQHGLTEIVGGKITPVPMQSSVLRDAPYPERMKHLPEVMDISRRLYENVKAALENGSFPVTIGGDHSAAIGTIAGAAAFCGAENLSVVYIDGHADINTPESSETGFIHGMSLSCAMGLCSPALTVGNPVNLYGKNTYIIGARSIDRGEYPIMAAQGVQLYSAEDVKKRGITAVMDEVTERICTPKIHISFDVDSMDGDVFPSTGYRMPGGLTLEEAEEAIVRTALTSKVCSFDCVEYNPSLDPDGADRVKLFEIFALLRNALER